MFMKPMVAPPIRRGSKRIVRLVGQRKDLVGLMVDMTCILMVIVKNRPPRRSGKHTKTHTCRCDVLQLYTNYSWWL